MSLDPAARSRRNAALRLAVGIVVGLLVETVRGAALPTLAPIIALQLLAAISRPPGARLVAMLTVVTAAASALAYLVALMTVDQPLLYATGVGVLYLWGFAFAFLPRLGPVGVMIITMTVVITGIAASSTGVALGIMISLVQSVAIGFVVVLLAHAILPSDPGDHAAPSDGPADPRLERLTPTTRAILATAVILPAHLVLFWQGAGAILVLMTTATMLRQPGLAASARYSISFAAGNLLGAVVAALAMLAVSAQGSGAVMISVTAAAALLLAWLSARGPMWRAVMVPGMVAFVVLYGLVYSPYVETSEVSITARAAMVVIGAVYALGAVSVLAPILLRSAGRRATG